MNRYYSTRLLWISLLLCAWVASAQDHLYVLQVLDESLARIDPGTGQVNSQVLDLGTGCNDVVAANGKLYVTNSSLNTVQEIDLRSEATIRQLPTTGGINPFSCALINEDTLAVSCLVTDNVVLLRLSDGLAVGSLPVGNAPEGIVVQGDYFFVCITGYQSPGNFAPGIVKVYHHHTLQLVDSIRVGTNPQSAAIDETGRLHVVCTGDYASVSGEVDVVNLSDFRVDTVVHVGGTPSNVSFAGDYAWLAAGGWGADGYVYGYRLNNFAVLSNSTNPVIVGSGAYDIEGQPDGSFFVSCFAVDRVEHHAADGSLLNTYLTSDGPSQMVFVASSNSVPRRAVISPLASNLLLASPNPFNETVRLRLSTASIRLGYINIYNLIGELAARVAVQPGQIEVLWSPHQNIGSSISSSVYYARWNGENPGPVVKLVYIR